MDVEVPTGVWWENLKERDNLKNLTVDERKVLKYVFKKWEMGAWGGFIFLCIGTSEMFL
jgi:hypothetical protein